MNFISNVCKPALILIMLVSFVDACQTKKEKLGESDEINQTPTLPEARKPLPDTVRLEAKDFVFLPPKMTLPPSREVLFIIQNNGDSDHRIHFDFPYGNVELEEPIAPGASDSLMVKIPDQEGTYAFYCPQDSGQHKTNGMQGEIIVKKEAL